MLHANVAPVVLIPGCHSEKSIIMRALMASQFLRNSSITSSFFFVTVTRLTSFLPQPISFSILLLKQGEIAKITCKPEYAYVELLACLPRKGSSLGRFSEERDRLELLLREEEKKQKQQMQAKLDAK